MPALTPAVSTSFDAAYAEYRRWIGWTPEQANGITDMNEMKFVSL